MTSTELFYVVARNRHLYQSFLQVFNMDPRNARHIYSGRQMRGVNRPGARVFYINDYHQMEDIAVVQELAQRLGLREIRVIL